MRLKTQPINFPKYKYSWSMQAYIHLLFCCLGTPAWRAEDLSMCGRRMGDEGKGALFVCIDVWKFSFFVPPLSIRLSLLSSRSLTNICITRCQIRRMTELWDWVKGDGECTVLDSIFSNLNRLVVFKQVVLLYPQYGNNLEEKNKNF